MGPWYRVFGGNDKLPAPAAVLECLRALGAAVHGDFRGDDSGWYAAAIEVGDGRSFSLERFLADEEGIRAELNGWAAWLETCGDGPPIVLLMERIVQSRQLFTLSGPDERLCIGLCRFLAEATTGLWQADGRGIFAADGTLLVPEREEEP
jgi:hypothetical protein